MPLMSGSLRYGTRLVMRKIMDRSHRKKSLAPELLLKDDSLVKVDYTNKVNYLKVTINGVQQYIDISNPSGTFPSNAQFQDAQTLQPFSLAANENKQVWLTVHVPSGTPVR